MLTLAAQLCIIVSLCNDFGAMALPVNAEEPGMKAGMRDLARTCLPKIRKVCDEYH